METKAIILSGYGLNTEHETKYAIETVGGNAKIVHINELIAQKSQLGDFNLLIIPGGSSFGDHMGAGKILANKLKSKIGNELVEFIKRKNLVLGIANGFQALVKMGLLPSTDLEQKATMMQNKNGIYINNWALFKINKRSPCIFTKGIECITLPIRNHSSRFHCNGKNLNDIIQNDLNVMQYVDANGNDTPHASGSVENIAGLCDKTGHVFGMMPHPESFCFVENCPSWIFGLKKAHGLSIFRNAVEYLAKQG
ncbi:MAG: phosphoribosylformylglycinamidine synthase subunit PurQ [Candidatus Micrarchaeota archaeon]